VPADCKAVAFDPCRTLLRRSCFEPSGQHIWGISGTDKICRISPPSWSARMNSPSGLLIAILPCNDLDASERFYNRLGFARPDSQRPARGEPDTYRMLSNGKGGYLHLTDAVEGWLIPGRNPFGLYLYLEDVDAAAREFQKSPEDKPWGCMNLPCLIQMKRWSVLVGRPVSALKRSNSSRAKVRRHL